MICIRTSQHLVAAALCALVACATRTPPAPPARPATQQSADLCGADAPNSASHCACLGGYVRGDTGDGKVACPQGETELARVQHGIEGAVCCKGVVE
jgi:hypothetical protein